jgi:septation ring formation regulator EzrA
MARAQLSLEEQKEDLERRYQLLEGERKATFETAQLNIRQNKEIIKQMKEENKTLRQQIAQLRQEAPPSTDKQIEEKMHELNQMKHKMDSVANEVKKQHEMCEKLEDKMNELAMNAVLRALKTMGQCATSASWRIAWTKQ